MLKLKALDAEDLGVISAHMQDALIRVGDLAYRRRAKQFALVASRYAWDEAKQRQRRRTGLHFDRVLAVKSHGIGRGDADAVLSLLAIAFEPGAAPSGTIVLTFSAGAAIRLAVECIEAQIKDLGPAWTAKSEPAHPVEGQG
jgi:hypothetical protein